tara:strand:- start:670 stop:903 length:234 start_codon:yes stop_codon:yes gene_type:complete
LGLDLATTGTATGTGFLAAIFKDLKLFFEKKGFLAPASLGAAFFEPLATFALFLGFCDGVFFTTFFLLCKLPVGHFG